MLKFLAGPAMLLAGVTLPAAGFAQETTITVVAPNGMNEDQARQWQRLERQANRLAERITDAEEHMTDEQREMARAQARLADAQNKLREEERELDRAVNRLLERRDELASVEAQMVALGGMRAPLALHAQ